MADQTPWLSIIGLGEAGPEELTPRAQAALNSADWVIGPPRHLSLLPDLPGQQITWPEPFAEGLQLLHKYRGQKVAALVSGNPFFYGAGSVIVRDLDGPEWQAFPAPSSFAIAAARLGWPLERITCLGLHAAPFAWMRPSLAPGQRLIVLVRDGAAVADLASYLCDLGFGESRLIVLQALGGPREKIAYVTAAEPGGGYAHPVAVAIEVAGRGDVLTAASGRADALFEHDGQISKRPVRALALSALAPRPGEMLWDIGGGSGSISLEWLLSHRDCRAISIESHPERAARIKHNAEMLGVDHVKVVLGSAPEALSDLPPPDAVFIGGGLSEALLRDLTERLKARTRLVAHAVTLESEALFSAWQAKIGGDLMRIELSQAEPLGSRVGWKAAYPIVQWRVTL